MLENQAWVFWPPSGNNLHQKFKWLILLQKGDSQTSYYSHSFSSHKKTQPSAVGGNTANSKGNFRIILLQPCFLDLKLCEIVIIMWKGGILFCCCRYVSPQLTVYVHYLYKDCTYWNEIWYRCKFNSNNHSFRSLSL